MGFDGISRWLARFGNAEIGDEAVAGRVEDPT
jgi:hypothetical protein